VKNVEKNPPTTVGTDSSVKNVEKAFLAFSAMSMKL
jgi:hypothetical protein